MKIIVNDASVLFDLIDIDLFDKFFMLDHEFHLTDMVKGEFDSNYLNKIDAYVKKGSLIVNSFDENALEAIWALKETHTKTLSLPDCSCIYLAIQISAMLLTGDKPLRKTANKKNIECHGTLWVLEQLIKQAIITECDAKKKLESLMDINKRLPKNECEKLLKNWDKS